MRLRRWCSPSLGKPHGERSGSDEALLSTPPPSRDAVDYLFRQETVKSGDRYTQSDMLLGVAQDE